MDEDIFEIEKAMEIIETENAMNEKSAMNETNAMNEKNAMNEETAMMDEVINIFELKVSGLIAATKNEHIKIVEVTMDEMIKDMIKLTKEMVERAIDDEMVETRGLLRGRRRDLDANDECDDRL